ncbi:MAG: hypothetical protein IT478_12670, partial [Xanthomonadales bacterium]|nr:hypothetical protein [Xanthomonadales bacterium]
MKRNPQPLLRAVGPIVFGLAAFAAADASRAFDSATVSGLGVRNIGSAAMSGRISAVAAFNREGKTTV